MRFFGVCGRLQEGAELLSSRGRLEQELARPSANRCALFLEHHARTADAV